MRKLVVILSAVLTFSACSQRLIKPAHMKTHPIESAMQLGHIKLTVSKPVPWNSVADDYKPNFKKPSADLLTTEVSPRVATDYYASSIRQSVSAEVQYSGGQINNTLTETSNSSTKDGVDSASSSSDSNTSLTKKTPAAPTISPQLPSTSLNYSTNDQTQYDPTSKYRAATALYQRIQTLNNYLQAEYDSRNDAAFLVHAQITPSIYAKNQPYNLYSTLRLHFTRAQEIQRAQKFASPEAFAQEFQAQATQGQMAVGNWMENILENYSRSNSASPDYKIFPLLLADNPERVVSERRANLAKQLVLKVIASGGQLSGGAGMNRLIEQLSVLSGDEVNNLMTLSQSSERDLTVMIGAGYDPDSRYALRDKSVEVSFVVVLPRAHFAVSNSTLSYQVGLDNQFRHVLTGELLPTLHEADIKRLAKRYLAEASSSCISDTKLKGAMLKVKKYLFGEKDDLCWIRDRSLYLELLNARRQLNVKGHKLEFGPLLDEVPDQQTVVFTDDKKALTLSMAVKPSTDLSFLSSALLVNPTAAAVTDTSQVALNTHAAGIFRHSEASQKGRVLTLQYPSLRALGYDFSKGKDITKLLVSLQPDGDSAELYSLAYRPEPKTSPPPRASSFSLAKITPKFDGGSKDKMNAVLLIKPVGKTLAKDIASLRLTLTGGILDSLSGLDKMKNNVKLVGPGLNVATNSYTFTPGKEVAYRITLEQLGPQTKPISVSVVGLDKNKKIIKAESALLVYK